MRQTDGRWGTARVATVLAVAAFAFGAGAPAASAQETVPGTEPAPQVSGPPGCEITKTAPQIKIVMVVRRVFGVRVIVPVAQFIPGQTQCLLPTDDFAYRRR